MAEWYDKNVLICKRLHFCANVSLIVCIAEAVC